MILPASGKHAARAREKIGQIEIRYLPHKNQAEFAAFEGFCAILYMGTKNPRGFLIKDELFTQLFSNVFDMLWAQAKK